MCSIQAKKVTVQARKVTETGVAKQEPAVASEQLEASERRPPNIVSHLALLAHPITDLFFFEFFGVSPKIGVFLEMA